eukprot:4694492-Pleurochrysis_carterae.AAC.2
MRAPFLVLSVCCPATSTVLCSLLICRFLSSSLSQSLSNLALALAVRVVLAGRSGCMARLMNAMLRWADGAVV